MLKASQPEKKPQPVTPKPQNGTLPKKEATEKSSKNIPKDNVSLRQTDTGKKAKHKSGLSKDAQVKSKGPAVSETKQSAAPKRKKDGGKSNGEQAAKKKKPVVEETKPTE